MQQKEKELQIAFCNSLILGEPCRDPACNPTSFFFARIVPFPRVYSLFGDIMLYERAERIKVRIERLIWLDEIVEKLEKKHKVIQDEVREVLEAEVNFRFVEKGNRPGENVYAAMGRTQSG